MATNNEHKTNKQYWFTPNNTSSINEPKKQCMIFYRGRNHWWLRMQKTRAIEGKQKNDQKKQRGTTIPRQKWQG